MRRGEALSLAEAIGSYWALVNDGIRTFADADGVIDDLADAIGREAEEGGWYSEWDEALSRARPSRPGGMTFGEQMHALANPQCKVNTIAEELARLLGNQGLAVGVKPGDLTGTYVVTVNW